MKRLTFTLFLCLSISTNSLNFKDFYHPFKEDDLEQSTVVDIMFPAENKSVITEFNWELDELQVFTYKLVEDEQLSKDQKDAFKDFVGQNVREAKKANREVRESRKKVIDEMSEEAKVAYEQMGSYKFYPMPSTETPVVSSVKLLAPLLVLAGLDRKKLKKKKMTDLMKSQKFHMNMKLK